MPDLDPGVPQAPAETSFDPPDDTLGSQIARTDAALAQWRDESVRRRAEYDERVAREREASSLRRMRLLGLVAAAGGLLLAGSATAAVLVAAWLAATAPTPLPAPVVVAPPVVDVAVAPVAEPPGPVELLLAPPAPGPEVREAKLWSNGTHARVSFATTELGPVVLRWKDAAGREALEPMGCVGPVRRGLRQCGAGRTHGRIAFAVRTGAHAGPWTVEACAGGGCTVVGTFLVGG